MYGNQKPQYLIHQGCAKSDLGGLSCCEEKRSRGLDIHLWELQCREREGLACTWNEYRSMSIMSEWKRLCLPFKVYYCVSIPLYHVL